MLKTTGHNTWFVFAGIPSSGRCFFTVAVTVVFVVTVVVTVVVLVLTVFAIIFLSFREKSYGKLT